MPKKKETEQLADPVAEVKKVRKYTGPMKGSEEAKDRMAKVRAAQYAKNNLVYAQQSDR